MQNVSNAHSRREFSRFNYTLPARVQTVDHDFACTVLDISGSGARIKQDPTLNLMRPGQQITILLPKLGTFVANVVWRKGSSCGLAFKIQPNQKATLQQKLINFREERL